MKLLSKTGMALCLTAALAFSGPASAEMVLSQVIVDLLPNKPTRGDIEVFNDGPERMYVAADPFEVVDPGTPEERRVPTGANFDESGLLVSPKKFILEPGARQTIRVAVLGDRPDRDRVYRLSIRPVAGPLLSDQSALKVMVGYDALVLVRPAKAVATISGSRDQKSLELTNVGNTAQELFDGHQCDFSGANCRSLPAKRLYPGARWKQTLPFDTPVNYKTAVGPDIRQQVF